MSWRPEVIADSSSKWCPNGLRFETELEALAYVSDLAWRWILVTRTRVTETSDPVNAEWTTAGLRHLKVTIQ